MFVCLHRSTLWGSQVDSVLGASLAAMAAWGSGHQEGPVAAPLIAPGRPRRYRAHRAGARPRFRVARRWRSQAGAGGLAHGAKAAAKLAFKNGGFALGDAFLPGAEQFAALVAQGALAHEGEALGFGVGAEAADARQGLLHRRVVSLWDTCLLLPVFEKGDPGGQGGVMADEVTP